MGPMQQAAVSDAGQGAPDAESKPTLLCNGWDVHAERAQCLKEHLRGVPAALDSRLRGNDEV